MAVLQKRTPPWKRNARSAKKNSARKRRKRSARRKKRRRSGWRNLLPARRNLSRRRP